MMVVVVITNQILIETNLLCNPEMRGCLVSKWDCTVFWEGGVVRIVCSSSVVSLSLSLICNLLYLWSISLSEMCTVKKKKLFEHCLNSISTWYNQLWSLNSRLTISWWVLYDLPFLCHCRFLSQCISSLILTLKYLALVYGDKKKGYTLVLCLENIFCMK